MPRIGAEKTLPGSHGVPVGYCRLMFLQRIARRVPQVLESLGDYVLPLVYYSSKPLELDGPVIEWTTTWRLTDPWLVRVTCDTLNAWRKEPHPLPREKLVFQVESLAIGTFVPVQSVDWCRPYGPLLESQQTFVARVNQWIRMNLDAADQLTEQLALGPAPEKRGDVGLHFEWLALWQCLNWSDAEIANEYDLEDFTTIQKARSKTANLIGLTLRK